jgi:hypothetical protein
MTVTPITAPEARDHSGDVPPQPPPGAELTEAIIFEADGRITLRWEGTELHLRRPLHGQYRRFLEADQAAQPKSVPKRVREDREKFASIVLDAQSALKGDEKAIERLDAEEMMRIASRLHTESLREQLGARSRNLAWWRLVCNGNDEGPGLADGHFPDDDDACPLWLSNDQPAIDAIQHWLSVPSVAPGS